ncbi:SMP-30/gluconolactonase/LRE family protein [Pseudidiomarina sp. 1APR75-33.1]|uniref:SMP-30/gluconolactonase/LRE family protein n=1 Tax=Pseudidiomarina terrestris TaxID=2820060 RepID=UPI00264C4B6B|nr:SMP-30/gluconolactonase/LRE family protein [Pseudidiomarina sp. 1APR75-33.1]MDN7127676.1 SMP-30/gluconolactonase/LRE family protein [Pseudidiomarina sp. 1APR75-33.1]
MLKRPIYSSLLVFSLLIPGVSVAADDAHEIETISTGHRFTEGPLWYNNQLWFSDIPNTTVYTWSPDGTTEVAVRPSGQANGLALDNDQRLLMAQHSTRRIARLNDDGSQTALASSYQGNRLNSPNDLTVAADGSIYFTDPPFAIAEEDNELGFAGVFKISATGELSLLDDALELPNGIALSPDQTTLYVNDAYQWIIYAYDLGPNGVSNKRTFARLEGTYDQGMDGISVASDGTIYVAGPEGIYTYAADGELLEIIELPDFTSNVAVVETDSRVLYVTNQTEVLRIKLNK